MAGQSKGRKIGNKKKQPAMKRYIAENRAARNKRIRAEREQKRQKQLATRKLKVPKGTARAKARGNDKARLMLRLELTPVDATGLPVVTA